MARSQDYRSNSSSRTGQHRRSIGVVLPMTVPRSMLPQCLIEHLARCAAAVADVRPHSGVQTFVAEGPRPHQSRARMILTTTW
jgi:hypothetical protein